TPNRSDATSHIGVARDLAVLETIRNNHPIKVRYPSVDAFAPGKGLNVEVEVRDTKNCPRYSGLCIKNVKVKPSPEWLQKRLLSVGLRPINNVVDVTNFVLMETGQPMHAFDISKIKGNKIVVRAANAGETMTTLDGLERKLSPQNLMICNVSEPMCIAGVFGGLDAGVSDTTTDVFLESAYFNPVSIRKTAREHGLATDASFRYERGADPDICLYALKRATLLLQEVAGGQTASDIVDCYPEPIRKPVVEFTLDYINRLVGQDIEAGDVKRVLEAMEMQVEMTKGATAGETRYQVTVPLNKTDVTRPADVAEEFLRIYGYNRIDSGSRLSYGMRAEASPEPERVVTKVSEFLSHNGFDEIMNNSLCSENYIEWFGLQNTVKMLNPLSKEMSLMRTDLLFGALSSIMFNLHHKQGNIRFYEFGRTYFSKPGADAAAGVTERFTEENHLGLWLCGNDYDELWQHTPKAFDFYTLKSFVEKICNLLRINMAKSRCAELESPFFAYGLQLELAGKPAVKFGEVKASVCERFDIKAPVFYADFNWDAVLKAMPKKAPEYREVNRFPEVRRDLALLVDKGMKFSQIEQAARKTEKNLLKKVSLFDVYEGKNLPEGKKSYAVSFVLQEEGKTLTDKQIEKTMEKITAALQNDLGCALR
ncbi:MAG: phenylalanine--tRNA ligase subunit beta, partial [Bacteroides sp.]|nr:phenylalanine--tRNA ligase subunit beta [Bacteroides sp.]